MKIGVFISALLIPVFAELGALSDEIRILDLRKSPAGSGMELTFASQSSDYYEVWTAEDPAGEWRCTAMILGADGWQKWGEDAADGVKARYYRLVKRSRSEAADADNDGLDDVLELTRSGMNPLAPDRSVALSVSTASEAIAAGALPTKVHQAEVVIQTIPALQCRLSVWLEGGDGYVDGGISSEGSAKLESGGSVFVAGGSNVSNQPIFITTDTNGRATLRLTSSNEINEQCRVHARLGTHAELSGSQAQSSPVTFALGQMEVEFPRFLARDAYASAVVKRTLNGVPIPGHEVEVYVRRVRVNSKDLTVTREQTDYLASYAAIEPLEKRQRTDESGQAVAPVFIHDVEGLGYVEVRAVDLQVFGK